MAILAKVQVSFGLLRCSGPRRRPKETITFARASTFAAFTRWSSRHLEEGRQHDLAILSQQHCQWCCGKKSEVAAGAFQLMWTQGSARVTSLPVMVELLFALRPRPLLVYIASHCCLGKAKVIWSMESCHQRLVLQHPQVRRNWNFTGPWTDQ